MQSDLGIFTSQQVMRITRVSKRRLEYWIQHNVFQPEISRATGRGSVRLYSFQNLLEVKVAVWLRNRGVSLQLIRKIVSKLKGRGIDFPLSEVSFAVIEPAGKAWSRHPIPEQNVVLQLAGGTWETGQLKGQKVMDIVLPLKLFREELNQAVGEDRSRSNKVGKVERRRGVLGSAPVVAGTRVPISAIWALHRAGYDIQRILENYPGLELKDIKSAIRRESERRRASA